MSLFGRFFNNKTQNLDAPNIPFGRFSDAYKTDAQHLSWENAVAAFEREDYLNSLELFLAYLKNDNQNNVKSWIENGSLQFEIIQGSKKIIGLADSEKIEVESKVAQTEGLQLSFMRQLMERNYELKYSRFALDKNDDISMRFDTDLMDASPYKLYNALKEVATNSDKLDDILVDEYKELTSINNQHIEETTDEERNVKYEFVKNWIEKTLQHIEQLQKRDLDAGVAYLLLDLAYKMDYLIKPEGYMMETLERVHRQYFARDKRSVAEKCEVLIEEFKNILARPKEELIKEMYHTIATFGITSPVTHDRVVSFIDGELPNINWYLRNNHPNVALSIAGYITGYCMFDFAVPKPIRSLFHLYYEIIEGDYFRALGYQNNYYNPDNGKFDKTAIRQRIHQIAKYNQKKFPHLQPNTSALDFKHLQSFAYSYLMMIRQLDLSLEY